MSDENQEAPKSEVEAALEEAMKAEEANEATKAGDEAEEAPKSSMWTFMTSVLKDIGPRGSASPEETALARKLEQDWSKSSDVVRFENFKCHPKAFLGLILWMPLVYAVSLFFYVKQPWIAFLFMGAMMTAFFLEFVRYREVDVIEKRYPEGESQNVSAILRPKSELKRRVIICAHTDSAYECLLWWKFKMFSVPIMAIALLSCVLLTVCSFARGLAWFFDKEYASFFIHMYNCLLIGFVFVAPFMFFHAETPVKGAMDNLAGVAVLGGLLEKLKSAKDAGAGLEHTEVQLCAFGCEEAGLRGSRRYVTTHLGELFQEDVENFVINLDGICDERELCVVSQEVQLMVRHDDSLVHLAQKIAARQNAPIKVSKLLLGATDACSFGQQNIRAVSIFATPAGSLVPNYHTRDDDLEHMRPQALTTTCELVYGMVADLDLQTRPHLPL